MKSDDVNPLVEQRHGRFALTRRVKPRAQPHHLDAGLRIDRTHAQREGVDALDDLGNRKARHITGTRRQSASGNAGQIAAFVIARIGHCHVGRGLIAGDGLELHVRKVFGDLERGLHVAKAGREDQPIALAGQVADHAFGVSAFGDVFNKSGLGLIAQRSLDGFARFVVLMHPARAGDRRDIDETDFQRLGRRGGLGKSGGNKTGSHERGGEVFIHGSPLHGPGKMKTPARRGNTLVKR